jgi:predicted nucleic acid-binding Zn ribbon protein
MTKKKNKRYNINKSAKVGTEIICPVCGKRLIKKSYQQAFCSTECKDKYWNNKRKCNGYFKQYNIEHPERLERIGINIDADLDCYIGDPEYESLAQITIDPDYDPYIEDEYY